jgi:DNA-binding MarR family transcriptional regulator
VSRTNKFGDCKTQTIVKVAILLIHRKGGLCLVLRDNSPLPFAIHGNMMESKKGNPKNHEIALLMAMLRFASVISRPMRDGVADPAGFSSNELRILMALSGEGESAGHDLAELMGMHAMNVSRALASLHQMGLVEPAKNIKNRRRKPYRISARGARAHVALEPTIAQVARHLFGALTARERAALKEILAKLDRQVEAWQPSERRPHVPRA